MIRFWPEGVKPGEVFKRWRVKHGYSQKQVARLFNTTQGVVSNFEHGISFSWRLWFWMMSKERRIYCVEDNSEKQEADRERKQ